jgi:hypothetical protein
MSRSVLKFGLIFGFAILAAPACGDDDAGAGDTGGDTGDTGDTGGDDGVTCGHLGCYTTQEGQFHLFGPTPADNPLDGANGTVRRYADHVESEANLTGLMPGHVYTFWWVFFNAADQCVGSPNETGDPVCFVADLANAAGIGLSLVYAIPAPDAGIVADDAGAFDLGKTFSYMQGDNEGAELGDGFVATSWDAEIHLIIRDHGVPLDGAEGEDQLSSYCGGCNNEPDGFCPNGTGPNSCREVAYARFAPVDEPMP